jgi:multiple sugar transport system ATP-binding protein
MRGEIKQLQNRLGITSIYVTHDQVEAMTLANRIVIMRDGHVQQVGAPLEVYDRPVNLFVAGFFGSPAMNFFRGVLAGDGTLRLDEDGASLPIGDEGHASSGIRAYAGREIVVGLRPEDLDPAPAADAPNAAAVISARLEYVEPVGNEIFLNLRFGTRDLVARVAPMALPEPGSDIRLRFAPAKLHCFDAQSGARIGG